MEGAAITSPLPFGQNTNSFHGMGMIAVVTPGDCSSCLKVPRSQVSREENVAAGRVQIRPFVASLDGMQSLCYEPLPSINVPDPSADMFHYAFL